MTGAGKPQILRKSHADDRCFPDRAATEDGDVRIDAVPYDHPDAVRLTGEVQQEYVIRYGERVPMATVAGEAGVGVATLYRHYPTREALLSALAARSLEIVLAAAQRAAGNPGPALASLLGFLDDAIERHGELILPLHGGPVIQDSRTVALREAISQAIDRILDRGQAEGSIPARRPPGVRPGSAAREGARSSADGRP